MRSVAALEAACRIDARLSELQAAVYSASTIEHLLPGEAPPVWTRERLAKDLGVHRGTLAAYLAGHRGPPSAWGRGGGRVSMAGIEAALGPKCDTEHFRK